jgi:hypothetical protein
MSGYYSPVPNYGGRQPDNVQNIKQFVPSTSNVAFWIYKKITGITEATTKITGVVNNTTYITTNDQTKDVVIPKDLIVTGSINNPSDITLKENVGLITETELDNLLEIRPKKYNFIHDADKKPHYGIIAQELEDLFPDLVTSVVVDIGHDDATTSEPKLIKTINYLELIPLLICKMQKMQQEIDMLKDKDTNKQI